jgi:hypothetical protein
MGGWPIFSDLWFLIVQGAALPGRRAAHPFAKNAKRMGQPADGWWPAKIHSAAEGRIFLSGRSLGLNAWLPHPSRIFCGRVGHRYSRRNSELFASPRCPLRLNLDWAFNSCRVVCKAAPFPIFRPVAPIRVVPGCDGCSVASRFVSLHSKRGNHSNTDGMKYHASSGIT